MQSPPLCLCCDRLGLVDAAYMGGFEMESIVSQFMPVLQQNLVVLVDQFAAIHRFPLLGTVVLLFLPMLSHRTLVKPSQPLLSIFLEHISPGH